MSRRGGFAVLLGLLLPAPVLAQLRGDATATIGGTDARGVSTIWSVAPGVNWETSRLRVSLAGDYRSFGRAGSAVAGDAIGSWFLPLGGPFLVEATGRARARGGSAISGAGAWEAGLRLHLLDRDKGLWLGVLPGHDARGGTVRWDAAAWKRIGNLAIQLQGSQTTLLRQFAGPTSLALDSLAPPDSSAPGSARNQVQVMTDLASWISWSRGRFQFSAATGFRLGSAQPAASPATPNSPIGTAANTQASQRNQTWTWWELQGTWWLADHLGLAGGVGRHPPDPGLLATGGSFVRLGFRVALDRRLSRPAGSRDAAAAAFRTAREGSLVALELRAPGVARVELMADFTDWVPVRLEQLSSGWWRIRVPIRPGLHYVNVRYDGGPWGAPPATRVIVDDFQRETGIVVIG